MAYIDETSPNSTKAPTETFLCLHGQPTWSFLYRKMIPPLLASSHPRRIIAPDLFGFGRSDKPSTDSAYTFNFHRNSLVHLVTTLDLQNVTLVVQDWGGLLGLTLPSEPALTHRFSRLIVMNTSLGTGQAPTQGFIDWRAYSNKNPDMPVGQLLARSCKVGGLALTAEEIAAYDAPYPDVRFKGGVRRFPNLVMTEANMEGVEVSLAARNFYQTSSHFGKDDVVVVCGMRDPVLGPPVMKKMRGMFKDGCWWGEIEMGGHFLQEWGGEVVGKALSVFDRKNSEAVDGMEAIDGAKSKASL